jgi:hypothetical protein
MNLRSPALALFKFLRNYPNETKENKLDKSLFARAQLTTNKTNHTVSTYVPNETKTTKLKTTNTHPHSLIPFHLRRCLH